MRSSVALDKLVPGPMTAEMTNITSLWMDFFMPVRSVTLRAENPMDKSGQLDRQTMG